MRPPSRQEETDPTRDVLATIEGAFAALQARDLPRLLSYYEPDARLVSVRYGEGQTEIRRTSVDEFLTLVKDDPDTLIESIRDPEIRVDRDVAAVWVAYELHRGTRFSHRGYNGFHLLRREGEWRIVAATYTVRPD